MARTFAFNQFNGGMVNDPRQPGENLCRVCTNFDIFTNPHKLTPYRDSVSGDGASTASQKQNFCVALWAPASTNKWRLFSLGVVSGTGKAEVLMKDLTTGGSSDLSDSGWLTPANNQAASGATSFELFAYYKTQGFIFGASGGTRIWSFDPTSSAAFDSVGQNISYTNICNGVVHPKDDILYIGYDNKIASNNNGSWTAAALTLPTDCYVTSLSVYQNFLAIGCAPLSGVGRSFVYLWDRNATLTNLPDIIDWGEGTLKVLNELEGSLIGISISSDASRTLSRVVFREYSGTIGSVKFQEFTSTTVPILLQRKQKQDNRLYFEMSISLNGTIREGVWSVARSSAGVAWGIAHERTPNNDTALGNGVLKGFFVVGDFMFISYVDNSSNYQLSKTNSAVSYTATAIYETLINPMEPERYRQSAGIRSSIKNVQAVGLGVVPLTSGQQAVLKYKVEGGSNTTILTANTVGTVMQEAVYDATGLPITNGREFEFRWESTGGAEIIEFRYKVEPLDSLV